jgi:hypothetical protein
MANFLSEDKKQIILALLRLKYSQREIQRRTCHRQFKTVPIPTVSKTKIIGVDGTNG